MMDHLKLLDYQLTIMGNGSNSSKYALNFKFPITPTKSMFAKGEPMVTKGKQGLIIKVLRLSTNYNGSNSSKYALNFKFPIITH